LKVSIVIPALNEEKGIGKTIQSIPKLKLFEMGYDIEIIVIDNGSIDLTGQIAKELGARVIVETKKGYGSAYKSGFMNVEGDIVVTCDADGTYPVEDIPTLVEYLNYKELDFLNTNRFPYLNDGAMSFRNKVGNCILTATMRILYGLDIKDSQSGMWIFRKNVLDNLKLDYTDWVFSQELKIEACYYGKRNWGEVPIKYYKRLGKVRLNGWVVGIKDLYYLFKKRIVR
jgi:dolichol-phosphate hexosyltransferase